MSTYAGLYYYSKDKKIIETVVKSDGYLAHTGVILDNYYRDPRKVQELFRLGFIHQLDLGLPSQIDLDKLQADLLSNKVPFLYPKPCESEDEVVKLYKNGFKTGDSIYKQIQKYWFKPDRRAAIYWYLGLYNLTQPYINNININGDIQYDNEFPQYTDTVDLNEYTYLYVAAENKWYYIKDQTYKKYDLNQYIHKNNIEIRDFKVDPDYRNAVLYFNNLLNKPLNELIKQREFVLRVNDLIKQTGMTKVHGHKDGTISINGVYFRSYEEALSSLHMLGIDISKMNVLIK